MIEVSVQGLEALEESYWHEEVAAYIIPRPLRRHSPAWDGLPRRGPNRPCSGRGSNGQPRATLRWT